MGDAKEDERGREAGQRRYRRNTFNRYFNTAEFEQLVRGFDSGLNMEVVRTDACDGICPPGRRS